MIKFNQEEFISNYQKLKSSRKMSEFYGCSKTTILNYAKKIGYTENKDNKKIKISRQNPKKVYSQYLSLQSLEEVGKLYSCSGVAVSNFLKKHGYTPQNFNSKLNSITDVEFIILYNKLKSAQKMAEYFNCSTTAILNHAKKISYDVNSNKEYKLNETQKEEILKEYTTSTSTQLAKKYNVSRGMITKLWYDNGMSGKDFVVTTTTEKDISNKTFGEWTVIYKTDKRSPSGNIIWHCKCSCGVERDVPGNVLRNGTSTSCGHIKSKGNFKIAELLLNNNIPFEQEKKFITCKDKRELPFDFYVNNSYLIEFDGEQHYKSDKNHWNTPDKFDYTKQHDNIKNQWCKENGIPLIRIPYWILDKLEIDDIKLETSKYII